MSDFYGTIVKSEESVKWTVPSFSHLPLKEDYYVRSPQIVLYESVWVLRLFPYMPCQPSIDPIFFHVCLVRVAAECIKTRDDFKTEQEFRRYYYRLGPYAQNKVDSRNFMCRIGFLDRNGTEIKLDCKENFSLTNTSFNGQKFFGCNFYKNRHFVQDITSLTVFCYLFPIRSSVAAASPTASKESPGVEKLLLDLKKLLENGSQTDVLIEVSDREFRAHQCILRARSPVFDAMFTHDTKEKKGGKVVISDLDSSVFQQFLEYVYTGNVGNVSDENVFGLYTAADKYGVLELKREAVKYMQRSLSAESFFEIMKLAFLHEENDLVQHVIAFFKNNLSQILATPKWQTLMIENSTLANELLRKAYCPVAVK